MDSDGEWEEEGPSWKGVSGTIILINAYDPVKTGMAKLAHEATTELVRGFMRTASSQHIGVSIYGTDTNTEIENAVEIFPLIVPSLTDFKKLQNIDIESYGEPNDFKMSDILWHTNKMFGNCKKLLSTKTVILLTRMDLPPVEADQKPALKRVKDLVDSGIFIKIINVSETSYHIDTFYENFLKEANKGQDFNIPEPVWGCSNILKMIQQKSHRHLGVASLPFEIGDGLSIGVGIYKFLQSQTKPKKVIADKETNQILSTATTSYKVQVSDNINQTDHDMEVDQDNGPREVPLLKSEILYYQVFGDKRIEFTTEEMAKLRNPFGPPMLKLLGFKPASILCKEKWYLKSCHYLYPDEKLIEGSTVAFKALHKACIDMSVIAICVMCTRVNSRPKIVALLPTTRPFSMDISIGFDIIPIPFVENMRNVPAPEECDKSIDEAHRTVMNDIVQSVTFNYEPHMFENPGLQKLHRAIEALALEEDNLQSYKDTTVRDDEEFHNIDSQLFEEIFGPFGAKAVKRPAEKTVTSAKREKTDEVDEELLSTRLNTNTVKKYTVKELRDILKSKDISGLGALTGLKKEALVDLVYEHFQS